MREVKYLVEIRKLTKTFGALAAVNNVNMNVAKGELRAIIGPNGAGKTTLFNLITGGVKSNSGQILFKGEDIVHLAPCEVCRRGIVRTYQITQIFPELTVLENIRLAAQFKQGGSYRLLGGGKIYRETKRKSEEIAESLGLCKMLHLEARYLSHGNQRLLEIAMALVQEPELLLLDEPAAGLSREETYKTVEVIKDISKKRKNTILLVEHDMDVVFYLADQITVLNFGQVIAEGPKEIIRVNEQVQIAYLGGL